MTGMLTLVENEEFYFDAESGDRPIRFIEKFCRHYEGKVAGQPFLLHPIQQQIIRDMFGWKWKSDRTRRFTDCYFEGAVGAGKSPLLAAIGLYGLMADGEQGAQIYSLANNYGQARVVFDCAKKFIQGNRELAKRLDALQFEIRHPRSNSTWRIVSGDGPGAGCRPSLVLGDEVHQWKHAGGYDDLRDRMAKRRQPLMICATNAGESQASFCWQLREKAIAALDGTGDPTLYPIVWAADETAKTDDPEAWKTANPLINVTVSAEKIRLNCQEAMKDAAAEAKFRRLYLGIWPKSAAGRWLNLSLWDQNTSKIGKMPVPPDAPLYFGVDLSQGDDLCALVEVGVTPDRFFLDAHFWLPRVTAEHYQHKEGIPYLDWAKAGYLTLLEEPTVSVTARRQIATAVLARGKPSATSSGQAGAIKAVCYDRYKADETIAALEAAGIVCVPIAQGYSVSPGCNELDRRIKEGSIVIADNPLLRFCAENCEVKQDDRGNIWPVKPNARGKYAGKRGLKIDGISAAVTVLTEARKHSFPSARKFFHGHVGSTRDTARR